MNAKRYGLPPIWAAIALLHVLTPISGAAAVLDFVENLEGPPTLGNASSLAFSPDGRHLYVTSTGDQVVMAFDASGPALERVATVTEGPGGPGTLRRPYAIAMSPDGHHVYVSCTAATDNAIVVYERDPASGALSFIEAEVEGEDGVDGIDDPFEMTLSPDGGHLYVSGFFDDAVATFRRDVSTGRLTFVEAIFNTNELGLDGAYSMSFTPDSRYLYVVGLISSKVTLFERDAATGVLTLRDTLFGGLGFTPHDVAVSHDGRHLYVTSNQGGRVYGIDESTGAPTFLSRFDVDAGVGSDEHIAESTDGRYVYGIRAFTIMSPFRVYERDPDTGELSLVETADYADYDPPVLRDPQALAVDPNSRRVALVDDLLDSLVMLEHTADSETVRLAEAWIDGSKGIPGLVGARSSVVSPDGRHVYVSGFWEDAVVALARDPESGRLSFIESYFNEVNGVEGLAGAHGAAISPDGRHLYVAAFDADAVAVFERDAASGKLSFLEARSQSADGILGLHGPTSVTMSVDGAYAYVVSLYGDIVVFARAEDGTLTFRQSVPDSGETNSVAVSPDGRYLYAARSFTFSVFDRDPGDGSLSDSGFSPPLAEICRPFSFGSGCVPRSVTTSPNGRHVYVGLSLEALLRGAILVYEHDPISGALSLVDIYTEGEMGYLFGDLPKIEYVAVSPDGQYVYAVSDYYSALVVFERNPSTGELTYKEVVRDDREGVDGLGGAAAVTVSPDNRHVYATSFEEDAVVVFKKSCITGGDTLCLNRERFQVGVEWRDFTGNTGTGQVVPVDSDDSGLFWFFTADNWEMLVKVLDGCGINDHFWVFAAATTNVEYTLRVMDLETAATTSYFNPLGNASAAITDTGALATCSEKDGQRSPLLRAEQAAPPAPATIPKQGTGTCMLTPSALCLNDSRFRVEVEWRDFQGQTGSGQVVPVGFDDSGLFWFFAADNWEMLVKVLDGCGINDRFWVFSAATTNVEYTLRVTDTETGAVKEYTNPLGIAADAVTDTGAFATCP